MECVLWFVVLWCGLFITLFVFLQCPVCWLALIVLFAVVVGAALCCMFLVDVLLGWFRLLTCDCLCCVGLLLLVCLFGDAVRLRLSVFAWEFWVVGLLLFGVG